jgi:hypothetical protein
MRQSVHWLHSYLILCWNSWRWRRRGEGKGEDRQGGEEVKEKKKK